MRPIPAGEFYQGSDDFYPEERPRRRRRVAAFELCEHPVTNDEFAEFVAATGHVTVAERPPAGEDLAGVDPALLVPGSMVFTPTAGPVPLHDWTQWWRWQPGANWRHPTGPGSSIAQRGDHPVVHIGHDDALAYCAWAGLRLPTEVEWEWAARGGSDTTYPWGDDFDADAATVYQGVFPWRTVTGGQPTTTPVGSHPANGYGLVDVVGNVWEWTATRWTDQLPDHCCSPGATGEERWVMKGGSHLCADSYCHRYRPAARQGQENWNTTSHLGFRCAR